MVNDGYLGRRDFLGVSLTGLAALASDDKNPLAQTTQVPQVLDGGSNFANEVLEHYRSLHASGKRGEYVTDKYIIGTHPRAHGFIAGSRFRLDPITLIDVYGREDEVYFIDINGSGYRNILFSIENGGEISQIRIDHTPALGDRVNPSKYMLKPVEGGLELLIPASFSSFEDILGAKEGSGFKFTLPNYGIPPQYIELARLITQDWRETNRPGELHK